MDHPNKTREDAIARVRQARVGCVEGAGASYLIELHRQILIWAESIDDKCHEMQTEIEAERVGSEL